MANRFQVLAMGLWMFGETLWLRGQTADGCPGATSTPNRFIFYWGTAQVVLTAEEKYRAVWRLKPREFRQMLLQRPYLWNGCTMSERVIFRLNGTLVVAPYKSRDDEASLLSLYERFSSEIAVGQSFEITDLILTPQHVGNIQVLLEEQPAGSAASSALHLERYVGSWLDESTVVKVHWGPTHYEVNQRDFFTSREVLEILRQQPVVEWQPHVLPQPVYAEVRITDVGGAQHEKRVFLSDPEAYSPFLQYVERYRFLFRSGARIVLALYSARYDRLFEHLLQIVEENDPRLALRRYRDAHRVRLEWGPLAYEWKDVYLARYLNADGDLLPTDLPVIARFHLARALLDSLLTLSPTLWIDGIRVPDLSFSLIADGHANHVRAEDRLPQLSPPTEDTIYSIRINNFHAAGYDLSALEAIVSFVPAHTPLSPPNPKKRIPSALALYSPIVSLESVEITFALPIATPVNVLIKDRSGAAVVETNGLYAAGYHTVSFSRHLFSTTGRYVFYLKTPYGEVQQTADLP
ncbi:MAG: hypothetical protein NZM43_02190 [Saprospiraceae bacterium]|nr:hypothetical protein [Saprospiraceae bacterium]MDW8483110.1 hypothetical protein [Saprospiraceae bacterium]